MRRGDTAWEQDFPMNEEVEDFSGRMRTFTIDCHDIPLGFIVRAGEDGTEGNGYQFAVYSDSTPYQALGRLREKLRKALATRHLSGVGRSPEMLHDTLRGRITSDGDGGVLLVVDGTPLDIDDLATLLLSHEGWEFELRIVDALK